MGSRKEEERNEKIIRGLMKLPPNRKCINCNSLGPQYVCTNFWSFVCMTCSGIHREFTHRVKSVSMAKFTSQEVEALQNGGNQRARELYLKDWDVHRQRLPESSNVDKIRQFIKDVYVDKKYSVGKTAEKPPRDTQNRGVCEDDTRRASSYHSFSQSPPYDYQYEDRRYGKQSGSLTRKPGSDRGRYEGKMSSFVYSPGRGREQMYDDRFSNEGSVSRVSDYSASSRAGEPFRYGAQSPPFQISVHGSSEDLRDRATNYFPPRSRSAGSFGSIDSNFMSQTSVNSVGFVDIPQSEQSAAVALDKLPFPESSVPRHSDSLDFFEAPIVQQNVSSSVPPIDLFQLPEAPPQGSSTNAFQPPRASTSAVNLFAVAGQPQSTLPLSEILPDLSASRNEGWATFDTPPKPVVTPNSSDDQVGPTIVPSVSGVSAENLDNVFASLVDTGMQWPSDQDSSFDLSNILSTSWNEAGNTQLWNAFEDPFGAIGLAVGTDTISSTANQHLGIGGASMERQSLGPESFDWAVFPLLGGKERQLSSTDRKSSNPFDLPYEVEVPESNTFMDMSSLHGALPNGQVPSSFEVGGDVSQVQPSWHPQNPASPYIAGVAGQGGITYLTPLPPTTAQVPNASASIRGNPFA